MTLVSSVKATAKAAVTRLSLIVVPLLGAGYVGLVRRTVRWEWVGAEQIDRMIVQGDGGIVAFWHGRIAMMLPVIAKSTRPVHVVISNNRDGEIVTRVLGRFGGTPLRGSTRDPRKKQDKGGAAALRTAVQKLDAGEVVALTPDGPRGPRMRAQAGAAVMSAMTGRPVLPFAWATRRARVLRSWDRFLVPWPFDRGIYVVGDPILPQGTDEQAIEAHRLAIETALNEITRRVDLHLGRDPVEPK